MTEEEKNEEKEKEKSEVKEVKVELSWGYCPVCGNKIPKIQNLRFCMSCGLDLLYVKEHKELPPQFAPNIPPPQSYQPQYPPQYPPYYAPGMYYKTPIPKLADEEITLTKDKKLWSTLASLFIPLGAFVVMNIIVIAVFFVVFLLLSDINAIYAFISNPYFIIISSLIEIMLIVFPIWYVGKYLQEPKLKNRLRILGITRKGYNNNQLTQEIFIGLAFAVIGLFLVAGVSIATILIVDSIPGVQINQDSGVSNSDVDYLLSGANILILVLFVIVMLVVVGPCEEALFRGFMQKGLVRTLGEKWGIIITALVFASIHLVALFLMITDPISLGINFILIFAPYFAISIMLGLMYRWRKENLIANIITHGVYNSLTLIIVFIFYGTF